MMSKMTALLAFASAMAVASAASAVTISNTPSGSISSFGYPDSQTYGEVFTAPVTGTLDSFTLSLNGGVGSLYGAVGTWNGTAAYGYGFGSPSQLYQSASVASTGVQSFTFAPNVSVNAGSQYVAYLSVFGDPGANSSTSMPLGTASPGIDYFVWNNSSDPNNNPAWNYFANFGSASFSASFTASTGAVPEPASWAMMLVGFGLVGGAMRRRQKAAVSFG